MPTKMHARELFLKVTDDDVMDNTNKFLSTFFFVWVAI